MGTFQPIDDDEFNIPPVDFEPTLESILNDVDNQSLSEDEVGHHESGTTQQPQLVLEQIVSVNKCENYY